MVEGCSDAASLGREDSSSKAKCKICGELSVRKDYIGSQECMVSLPHATVSCQYSSRILPCHYTLITVPNRCVKTVAVLMR